jgi:hypothetical protein
MVERTIKEIWMVLAMTEIVMRQLVLVTYNVEIVVWML